MSLWNTDTISSTFNPLPPTAQMQTNYSAILGDKGGSGSSYNDHSNDSKELSSSVVIALSCFFSVLVTLLVVLVVLLVYRFFRGHSSTSETGFSTYGASMKQAGSVSSVRSMQSVGDIDGGLSTLGD